MQSSLNPILNWKFWLERDRKWNMEYGPQRPEVITVQHQFNIFFLKWDSVRPNNELTLDNEWPALSLPVGNHPFQNEVIDTLSRTFSLLGCCATFLNSKYHFMNKNRSVAMGKRAVLLGFAQARIFHFVITLINWLPRLNFEKEHMTPS